MNTRRDMIAVMGTALFATGAAPVDAKTGPWIKDREDAQHITTPFGEVRIYFKGETDELRLLELLNARINPGLSPHPPHQHPEEELLLVVEGEGEFLLDDRAMPCSAGTMLYAAPGHSHGIKNTGSAPLSVQIFKWQPK